MGAYDLARCSRVLFLIGYSDSDLPQRLVANLSKICNSVRSLCFFVLEPLCDSNINRLRPFFFNCDQIPVANLFLYCVFFSAESPSSILIELLAMTRGEGLGPAPEIRQRVGGQHQSSGPSVVSQKKLKINKKGKEVKAGPFWLF